MDEKEARNDLDPEPVPNKEHLNQVCKLGQGKEVCRYLCFHRGKMACAKGSALQSIIDERSAQGTMSAKGDNCSGPSEFRPTGT